ncbi:MAG: hypothetical protein LRY69_04035 [Gammaproteobacteria bacterium]|nr:hypothetical protein [Gammaproteobacteria bacterium]
MINAEGSEKEHQKTIELINAFNDEAKIHKEQLNKNEETFFLLLTHFYTINMLFQHYQFLYRDFPQRLSSEHFYTLWANFFTEIQQITYLTENQKNEVVDICRLNICAKLQHNDQQEFISALNRLFEIPLPHFLKKPFMSSDTAYKKSIANIKSQNTPSNSTCTKIFMNIHCTILMSVSVHYLIALSLMKTT